MELKKGLRRGAFTYVFIIGFNLLFSFGFIFARNYSVHTGIDQVTCKLDTLPQSYMIKFLGDLGPMWFFIEKDYARREEIWKCEDFCCNASKQYMVVKVELVNKSSEAIYLPKDQYLNPNIFISKDKLDDVYGPTLDQYQGSATAYKICYCLLLGGSAVSLLSMPFSDSLKQLFEGFFAGLMFLQSLPLILLNRLNQSKANIIKAARDKVFVFASHELDENGMYKVAPGEIFRDFLLVDLKKYRRSVLSKVQINLLACMIFKLKKDSRD